MGSDGRPAPIVPVQCGEEYRQNPARHFEADPVIGHQLQRFLDPQVALQAAQSARRMDQQIALHRRFGEYREGRKGLRQDHPAALRHEEMQARADRVLVTDQHPPAQPAVRPHHFPSAIKAYSTGPANSRVPPPSAITRRTPSGSSTRTPAR